MIRILVVEDDADKLRRVMACLRDVPGVDMDGVDDARDANAAKRLLRDRRYDLLVLDISIPARSDEMPGYATGLDLLDEILERDVYHTPTQIVGLTAHEEALAAAAPRFEADVLQVVSYDPSGEEWADRLARLTTRAVDQVAASGTRQEHGVHLAVLTALASPELDAVLALPWNWVTLERPDDPTTYHRGWYARSGERREVVAAAAPRMGMQASAALAMKMSMTFRPRYLAMTGILAGIRGEVEIGDVLVADPSWDYGSGKHSNREGAAAFAVAPHQIGLDPFVRGIMRRMSADAASLDAIRRGWRGGGPSSVLSMRLGPVASGAAVLEDDDAVNRVRQQHRKTLGIEMETYGVMVASEEAPLPQPRCFSIKSVCDFADASKDDAHQAYAAYTSAETLRLLCEHHL